MKKRLEGVDGTIIIEMLGSRIKTARRGHWNNKDATITEVDAILQGYTGRAGEAA